MSEYRTNYKENLTLAGIVGITVLAGAFLTFPSTFADTDAVDEITITVPTSCSLSSTGNNSHTAEISNGQTNSNIGETTIKAFCNDNNGFAIYAIGYTDDTYGKTVLTDTTLGSSYDIPTGTNITGNSSWAMKLSTITSPTPTYPIIIAGSTDDTDREQGDPDYTSFQEVPDTYTLVAKRSSFTDINPEGQQTAEGSTLKTTYQAHISNTQSAGTYTGKVKYTLVHPASEVPLQPQATQSGKICYYPNGANVEGTMGCQDVSSSVTLLASNFSRAGYGFAGWSDKFDYSTGAHFYGPNETISLTTSDYSSPNNGLSLYAVWIKSAGSLQDSSKVAQLCGTGTGSLTQAPIDGTAGLASVSALTDERDNQTYAIAKLADGNCWMIENLRLESTATANTSGSLAQGYNSSFIGLATAESEHFLWDDTTANSLYTTESDIEGKNTISGSYQAYRFPRYNNTNTSTRASSPTTNLNVNMYSYGNYYTWHAAIADTTYYYSGDHGTTSICPAGWRLPQGNTTTSGFGKLDVEMGGTGATQYTSADSLRWRKFPLNYLYSGEFGGYSVNSRGGHGYYWSSTTISYYSYGLSLYRSELYPGTFYDAYRCYGLSIRCLAL